MLIIRLALAATFLVAGASKLLDIAGSRKAVESFGISEQRSKLIGTLLPWLEFLIGGLLLVNSTVRFGAGLAVLQLLPYTWFIARELRAGRATPCYCFGQLTPEPVSKSTVVRNVVMLVAGSALVAAGGGPSAHVESVPSWLTTLLLATCFALLSYALIPYWLMFKARREASAEAPHDHQHAPKHKVGDSAPALVLTDAEGISRPYQEVITDDVPTVILFASPGCGPCKALIPKLLKWRQSLDGQLNFVIGQFTDSSELTSIADEYSIDLNSGLMWAIDDSELEAFNAVATPSAVVIDAEGKFVATAAAGGEAVEISVRNAIRAASGRRMSFQI